MRLLAAAVSVVAAGALGVYLIAVGLDEADKLASVLGLFLALGCGIIAIVGPTGGMHRASAADDQAGHVAGGAEVSNSIQGGTIHGSVIQGRNIIGSVVLGESSGELPGTAARHPDGG